MEIIVNRKYKKETYTIGEMLIDGKWFCSTLEDKDRGLDQSMTLSQLKKLKRYGETAIPTGRYEVVSYYWAKYQKVYPWLQNVPNWTGVLIHKGDGINGHRFTEGCILVGENKIKGGLINGEPYVRKLTKMVQECEKRGEKVFITIK